MATEAKTKQKHAGKTKRDLTDRAKIFLAGLIAGKTPDEALKTTGLSDSYIKSHKKSILEHPVMQRTFVQVLDSAGVTDARIADKISTLMDAKETKFFAHQGEVVDQKEVEALGIQAQMVEFAAKLKGHVKPTAEANPGGNTYIDLTQINIDANGQSGGIGQAKQDVMPDLVDITPVDTPPTA